MAAPMLRLRGSTITCIPIFTQYYVGLTCNTPSFTVFRARVLALVKESENLATDQIMWVCGQLIDLAVNYTGWEDEVEANQHAGGRKLELLEQVHDCKDRTTEYFRDLQNRRGYCLLYADLMATHIKHAVNRWNDSWENIREGRAREHYGQRD